MAAGIEDANAGGARSAPIALHPNAPNPSSRATTFSFDLARPGRIELRIYDMSGRQLRRISLGDRPAGRQGARIDLEELNSGACLYEILLIDGTNMRSRRGSTLILTD